MTPRVAVITVVHGRHEHLRLQQRGLAVSTRGADVRCVVAMDDPEIALMLPDAEVVACDRAAQALPLARARNLGAERALALGAELLVFLDVDCVPGAPMLERYVQAHLAVKRPALLCGPVTYLPPAPDGYRLGELSSLTNPHPARPVPPDGTRCRGTDYDLFWSLSFAVSAQTWRLVGGFCEEYVGYGGEDTDFAATAAARDVSLFWVGGAHAYHQYHPVSDPPVEHVDDIVANAAVFRRRWGRWPMPGWLDEFERRGMIVRDGARIAVAS